MTPEILPSDTCFTDSFPAGHGDCLCSRCGANILDREKPVRCYTTNEDGQVDESSVEWRYCPRCMIAAGMPEPKRFSDFHHAIPVENIFRSKPTLTPFKAFKQNTEEANCTPGTFQWQNQKH